MKRLIFILLASCLALGQTKINTATQVRANAVVTTAVTAPSAPVITPTLGTNVTWSYKIVARDYAGGTTAASAAGSTNTGAATLDGTHFNTITWTGVAGAASYDVYRTAVGTSPTTTGKIGTVTVGNALSLVDNALAGDSSTAPAVNSSGAILGAGGACAFLAGSTSGTASICPPAVAGTTTNPLVSSNVITLPVGSTSSPSINFAGNTNTGIGQTDGTGTLAVVVNGSRVFNFLPTALDIVTDSALLQMGGGGDVGLSRKAAGYLAFGTGSAGSIAAYTKSGMTIITTSDWTCGTGGTVSSCTSAQVIGTPAFTFTLPSIAGNWALDCDLIVGQATGATANSWNIITSSNAPTNLSAGYMMNTAATAMTGGALTGGSGTSTQVISPTWTLGATGTKMPVHIWAALDGGSASGTVVSLQLVAPTVGDLVTIYRDSKCSINP